MTYDSSKDARLLVAQRACAVLRQSMQRKTVARPSVAKGKVGTLTGEIESAVMTMLYLYQEPAELAVSAPMSELVRAADNLGEALQPVLAHRETPALQRATLQWCLRVLTGLPRRMERAGTTLATGIDLQVVEVRNVTKISSGLWLTRVSDGQQDHTVVTNIKGVRSGDLLGVAFLPPREVGGQISEAMYLGGDRRSEPRGTMLDETTAETREVTGILYDELGR